MSPRYWGMLKNRHHMNTAAMDFPFSKLLGPLNCRLLIRICGRISVPMRLLAHSVFPSVPRLNVPMCTHILMSQGKFNQQIVMRSRIVLILPVLGIHASRTKT